MDVLIACECEKEEANQYIIFYDKDILLEAIESSNLSDKEIIVRVMYMYSDPDELQKDLRNLAKVYPGLYEALAIGMRGDAWYDAITVQKKYKMI